MLLLMSSSLLLMVLFGVLGILKTTRPLEDVVEAFMEIDSFLDGAGSSLAVFIFSMSLRMLLAMNGINDFFEGL